MPFWLATSLFVTTFILVFEWERGGDAGRPLPAARLGGRSSASPRASRSSYVFRDLFYVRLP